MAGRITALKQQKRSSDRVNIFIDDQFAFSTSLNAALGLKKGQLLSDDDISALKAEAEVEKAYQRALHYLGYRARSRREVETYLAGKEISPTAIEAVIIRLNHHGYLNDTAFSETWVRDRETLKPKSTRALRYELRQKGVADADMDAALDLVDDAENAWRLTEARLAYWLQLDEPTLKRKLGGYLQRRGFDYEIIRTVLERVLAERETLGETPDDA